MLASLGFKSAILFMADSAYALLTLTLFFPISKFFNPSTAISAILGS